MEAHEWRNELEALQQLLASQQLQISTLQKQVGGSAPAVNDETSIDATL